MEAPTGTGAGLFARLNQASGIVHAIFIVLLAAFYSFPCLIHGLARTGDSILHATYLHQFSGQFWSGETYPRWMASANRGYGSPIFLIQYPLPYWIAALLRPILGFAPDIFRESREWGVYCLLVLASAGLAARIWLRQYHSPLAATAGAITYISLPYLLAFELYTDLAIGQLTVAVWMPLALAACAKLRLRFARISALGIVCALLVLSNFLAAFLFLPLMLAYGVACRDPQEVSLSERITSLAFSLGLGSCLAAVYVFPFFTFLHLFDVRRLLVLPNYGLSCNLGYVRAASLAKPAVLFALAGVVVLVMISGYAIWRAGAHSRLRSTLLLILGAGILSAVPGVGLRIIALSGLPSPVFTVADYFPEKVLLMYLLTIALAVFAYAYLQDDRAALDYRLLLLLVAASGAFFLTLPWSACLWKSLPRIATAVQFPHRLGLLLNIATTGLVAAGFDGALRRYAAGERSRPVVGMALMTVAAICGGLLTWRADWRWMEVLRDLPQVHADETRDVDHTYRMYVSPDNLEGFASLIGAATAGSEPVSVGGGEARLVKGEGTIHLTRESPRKLTLSFDVRAESRVQIGLVYSPLWRFAGKRDANAFALGSSSDGLLEVSLPSGRGDLELAFDGGRAERYGSIVSLVSVVLMACGLVFRVAATSSTRPTS